MVMDEKQKKYVLGRYIEFLKKLEVKNGSINIFTDEHDEVLIPLVDQIMKNKDVSRYMERSEVFWWQHTEPLRFRDLHEKKEDGRFEALYSGDEIEGIANKVMQVFEGLPYEHFFYFKLPFKLAEKVDVVALTDDVWIVKMNEAERQNVQIKQEASLSDLLTGKKLYDVDMDAVYFKVRVVGYGDGARAQAHTTFKRFSYLTSASGFITSQTWHRNGERGFDTSFSVCPALYQKKPMEATLPADFANYISGMKLKEGAFTSYSPPPPPGSTAGFAGIARTLLTNPDENYEDYYRRTFTWWCRTFSRVQNEKNVPEVEHVLSAIEWGFDGEANRNETMGFIQVCIGLEALLGDKKGGQKSLTEKLADRCAYLLGRTPTERKDHAEKFKEIYDLRSELVHGARPKVLNEHSAIVGEASYLLRRLVFNEINLSVKT